MIGKGCGYNHSYVVSCRGVVQLGDLVLGSPWWVPLSLMLVSLLCSLKSSIVQKIKSTWLSLLLRLFFYDLLQCSTQRQSVTINVMPPQINQSSSTQIKNRRFFLTPTTSVDQFSSKATKSSAIVLLSNITILFFYWTIIYQHLYSPLSFE